MIRYLATRGGHTMVAEIDALLPSWAQAAERHYYTTQGWFLCPMS